MIRIFAAAGLSVLASGCATSSAPVPARLAAEPDAAQVDAIARTVRTALKRNDLDLEPARLAYSSRLIVRPVAVSGMTDRVPGTPQRYTLMMDETGCWLSEDGREDRIYLPDMACRPESDAGKQP